MATKVVEEAVQQLTAGKMDQFQQTLREMEPEEAKELCTELDRATAAKKALLSTR